MFIFFFFVIYIDKLKIGWGEEGCVGATLVGIVISVDQFLF